MSEEKNGSRFRVAVVPVTPFQQNCSLVFDEETKRGAVVDPGGDLDVIEDAIRQTGLTIEKILLTHGHIDHAGGAAELREKLGVKIEGPHADDKFLLDNLPQSGARFGLLTARTVEPDRWLEDGDTVDVAGFTLEVISAPGHSPGSVVFFNRPARFALMGDVLFQRSIGRTDLPGGDHETLLKSIREKVLPLGDDVVFLPGHGSASRIGDERLNNPFLNEGA
ncbi:MAG: MBL fold metallo-hydrolase [Proteobacteria bacterium]|nr:MBL fold metallo-hydrolase [Pseudomonadota bacterium]